MVKRKTNGRANGNGKRNGNGKPVRRIGKRRGVQKPGPMGRGVMPTAIAYPGSNIRAMNNRIETFSGSDFITKVSVEAATTAAARILVTLPVSPSAFPGTRLTQLSQLWERYRFVRFALRYVPAVPVTLACQLTLYQDLDPTDDPTVITDVDQLVRQAVAQTGAQQWNFHVPKTIEMAKRCDDQFYYTGEDRLNERFTLQGKAYVIQITNPVNSEGAAVTGPLEAGSLFLDWTCQFNTPQINPEAVIASPSSQTLGEVITTDITGEEYSGDILELGPAVPRAWYICTCGGTRTTTGGVLYLNSPDDATAGFGTPQFSYTNTDGLNLNGSGIPTPGFLVVQAGADGLIRVKIFKTYNDEANSFIISMPIKHRTDETTTARNAARVASTGMLPRIAGQVYPATRRLPGRTQQDEQ